MKITKKNIAVIDGDNYISKWVEESGRLDHDQNMLPLVLQHIKKGDVVVDVGAYIGDHTVAYLEKVGKHGLVYAFEPSIEAYKCLVYNTKRYTGNVLTYNMALGLKHSKGSIMKVATNDGMNYITDGSDFEIVTLDSFEFWKLDFIKIDCEGYEFDVLLGAERTITELKPTMLIEINEMTLSRAGRTRHEIYNWLKNHGYQIKNIYPEQGLEDYQMDIICVHSND